jgi:hypothetical protein
MSINIVSFGSHDNYIDAANRISNQAKKLNIFDTINIYTGDDLKKDNDFWDKHGTFIENNKIGYGYWIWKPYLIYKTIEN